MRVLKADPEKLTKLRVEKGLSIAALAREAGVNYLIIMRLENEKNGTRPDSAYKIAKALDVGVNDLFSMCNLSGQGA